MVGVGLWVWYCPHPVTVYIRGPIKGCPYNDSIMIIQLLLRGGGGRTQVMGLSPKSIQSMACGTWNLIRSEIDP